MNTTTPSSQTGRRTAKPTLLQNAKRALSITLAASLLLTAPAGCGSAPGAVAPTQPQASQSTPPDSSGEALTIAGNTWGHGSWSIDIIFEACGVVEESAGNVTLNVANNEYRADKVISDLQNQLTTGVDAVLFLGMSQTLFPTAAQTCESAGVPFAFHSNIPAAADLESICQNPYYTGSVVSQEHGAGAAIAEIALEDGNRTAIISGAALGDYTMDQRIGGFTETFEAGGGEVLYVAHSADPTEGVQKANDFIAAYPDADMIYCAGGDFVSATISALVSRPDVSYQLYGTDISPETAQSILDGKVKALNGGQWIAGSLAMALLVNRLDGHPILDPDGNAPLFNNMNLVRLDESNAQGFIDLMTSGGLLTAEDFDRLLYRNNPDVDYQTFYDFIGGVDQLLADRFENS